MTPPPTCWTRPEVSDHRFVESCGDHTDGVVIPLRFDTPLPEGSGRNLPSRRTGTELKAAALAARVPFLIDLEAWRLPYLTGPHDASFGRDAQTVVARAVPLPLDPSGLASESDAQRLVRAAISAQAGAALTFAPDFQFASLDDPWLAVNLRCLRLTRALVGDRPVGAWIHVTLDTMLSGVLPFVAERYQDALPAGAIVALTVSDLRAEDLAPTALAMYFQALRAFHEHGLRVLVDRASEISIPAVGLYATGCILGTRLYRAAPASPRYDSPRNPRVLLRYLVGVQGRRVRRSDARARHGRGTLPSCAYPECDAVNAGENDNIELRFHNAHELRMAIQRARTLGAVHLISEWRDAPLRHLRCWAQALELANARSEEA